MSNWFSNKNCSNMFDKYLSWTTAVLGVDRFVRIKCFTKVKTVLTSAFILALISIAFLTALFNVVAIPMGLMLIKENLFSYVTVTLTVTIVIIMMFLQVLVMRTSNVVSNESTIDASQPVYKKINKVSMCVMLASVSLFISFLIISGSKSLIQYLLSKTSISEIKFTFGISIETVSVSL